MKKTLKKSLSLFLALVMLMTSITLSGFAALAETVHKEEMVAHFDFSSEKNFYNRVGDTSKKLKAFGWNGGHVNDAGGAESLFSYDSTLHGVYTGDGYVYLDDFASYIQDGRNFKLEWSVYLQDKSIGKDETGFFAIGTNYADGSGDGDSGYNQSWNNVLSLNYNGVLRVGGATVAGTSFPTAAAYNDYNITVEYNANDKSFTVTVNGVSKTINNITFTPSQMNGLIVGNSTKTSYASFVLKSLKIYQIWDEEKEDLGRPDVFDGSVEQLDGAMKAFENKISSEKLYTNYEKAYNAYVACQKAKDTYKYVDNTTDLKAVTETLWNIIDNDMKPATAKIANKKASFQGDSKPDNSMRDGMNVSAAGVSKNILYTKQVTGAPGDAWVVKAPNHNSSGNQSSGEEDTDVRIYYSPTVLMYDGVNTPSFPVMAIACAEDYYDNALVQGGKRYFYGAYPCASDGTNHSQLTLPDVWYGQNGNKGNNFQYGDQAVMKSGEGGTAGAGYCFEKGGYPSWAGSILYRSQLLDGPNFAWGSWGDETQFTNVVRFTSTMNKSTTMQTLYPYWYTAAAGVPNSDEVISTKITPTSADRNVYNGSGQLDKLSETSNLYMGGAKKTPIYVINYQAITTAVETAVKRLNSYSTADDVLDVKKYKEGGLQAYMKAIDAAVNFDPNTYFSNVGSTLADLESAAGSCKTKMDEIIAAFNTVDTTNTDKYAALRTAFDTTGLKATYEAGNDGNKYTADSWKSFTDAYNNGVDYAMKPIMQSGYILSKSAIDEFANALTDAYNGLETVVIKVDTTEIVNRITEINTWDFIYFTEETAQVLRDAVANAKIAIWGSEEMYGDKAASLDDTEENRAIVAEQLALINNAVKQLRISMDAAVETSVGHYYSLNEAVSIEFNPSDYSGTVAYDEAVKAAEKYAAKAVNAEFTDYNTQVTEYINQVKAVINAFNSLKKSILTLNDGEILTEGKTSTGREENYKGGSLPGNNMYVAVGFTTPVNSIVIRTTHDSKTVPYGKAKLVFGTTADSTLTYNRLDGINLMNPSDNTNTVEINSKRGYPPALNDEQKTKYQASLSRGAYFADDAAETPQMVPGVAIGYDNIVVSGGSNTVETKEAVVYSDGTSATFADAVFNKVDVTDILGNLRGGDDGRDTVVAIQRNAGSMFGEVHMTGDMTVTVPGTPNKPVDELDVNDAPSYISYTTSAGKNKTNLGATYIWNHRPDGLPNLGVAWAGYGHLSVPYESNVAVIEAASFIDLIKKCDSIKNAEAYTETSWVPFVKALDDSKALPDFDAMEVMAIAEYFGNNYRALLTAYNNLEYKKINVGFNFINANGGLDGASAAVEYYGTMASVYNDDTPANTKIKNLIDGKYVDGNEFPQYTEIITEKDSQDRDVEYKYTYTFDHWETTVNNPDGSTTTVEVNPIDDLNVSLTANKYYTAVYTYEKQLLPADFTVYNANVASLMSLFADKKFTVKEIAEMQTFFDGLSYFNMTDADRELLSKSYDQDAINAEAQILQRKYADVLVTLNKRPAYDLATAEAAAQLGNAAIDKDIYEFDANAKIEIYQTVKNFGDVNRQSTSDTEGKFAKDIQVLIYDSQKQIDKAVADFLNSLQLKSYDIIVNGTKLGTEAYGTPVQVHQNADGTYYYTTNDDLTYEEGAEKMHGWYYQFKAPSTNDEYTASKFNKVAKSLGFILKGDTSLVVEDAENSNDDICTVTIQKNVNGTLKTIAVETVNQGEAFTLPAAPRIAFYNFVGYEGGYNVGDAIQIDGDTTFVANYEPVETGFETYYITLNAFWDGSGIDGAGYFTEYADTNYNEKITMTSQELLDEAWIDDVAFAWAKYDMDTGLFTVVHYGEDYSFYACEDADIYAITYNEYYTLMDYLGDDMSFDPNGYPYGTTVRDSVVKVKDENLALTKFSMIGTYVLPEGMELVECGILFAEGHGVDLTYENAMKPDSGIRRFKSSSQTVGNQFVISLKADDAKVASFDNGTGNISYASYAICKDSRGNSIQVYSPRVEYTF